MKTTDIPKSDTSSRTEPPWGFSPDAFSSYVKSSSRVQYRAGSTYWPYWTSPLRVGVAASGGTLTPNVRRGIRARSWAGLATGCRPATQYTSCANVGFFRRPSYPRGSTNTG